MFTVVSVECGDFLDRSLYARRFGKEERDGFEELSRFPELCVWNWNIRGAGWKSVCSDLWTFLLGGLDERTGSSSSLVLLSFPFIFLLIYFECGASGEDLWGHVLCALAV